MQSTILIHTANIHDLPEVQRLFTELSQSDLPYDTNVDVNWAYTKDGEKYFKEKIAKELCHIALTGKKIIGYSTFGIKEVPTWRLVKVTELQNLFVDEKYRGNGVGKSLMKHFLQWSKEKGAQKVSVNVFADNKNALGFYEKCGFKKYDVNLEMEV